MISVIIPVYNVELYLEKCVDSLIEQTYKDIEILLINDGSTDNSYKICQKLKDRDDRIYVINIEKNRGVSYARNIGITMSKGKYLVFVDADDFLNKIMLEILLKNIEENKADISMCDFKKVNDKFRNETIDEIEKSVIFDKNDLLKNLTGTKSFQGFVWNKMYKKDIIDKNNIKFDENIDIYEDMLFNCEYIDKINKGSYVKNKLYYYIQRNSSAYNGDFNNKWYTIFKAHKKILEIYEKNNLKDYIGVKYNLLISNLDFKEKLVKFKKTDKDIGCINITELDYKINIILKEILESNYISMSEKIKIFIKVKNIKLFIFLKNLKNIL